MFDPVNYLVGIDHRASITDQEVRFLFNVGLTLPLSPLILEIGVYHGRSACLLAYLAAIKMGKYVGIDHFDYSAGYSGPKGRNWVDLPFTPGSKEEVEGYLRERGILSFTCIKEENAVVSVWDNLVDLLHIDADHTSPGMDRITQKYVPYVKVGGIAAFDDYEPEYVDVIRCADIACNNGSWEDLGSAEGMKCWRKIKK